MTLASDFEVEHYLDHQAAIFLARFDPHTYLYLSRVMDYYDPFAEAYERVAGTRFLLDLLRLGLALRHRALRLHRGAADGARRRRRATTRSVSPWGHDSFLMDVPEYHAHVREFLGLTYQAPVGPLCGVMPATELCVIHPGSPLRTVLGAVWPPTCPPARRCSVLELETINPIWEQDPA